MTEAAMTQNVDAGAPTTDSTSTNGPVATDATPNSATNERPAEDSFEAGVKIDELPENVRETARSLEKQFKAAYTKKTQELAEHRKNVSLEATKYKTQVEQYNELVRDVLSNPDKIESYRKVFGIESTPQEQETPSFETVGDLVNHYETKLQSLQSQLEAKLENRLVERETENEIKSKWSSAVIEARQDPVFKKYEFIIGKMIKDEPKYKENYTVGKEKDVLQRALDDWKEMLKPDLEAAKNEVLESFNKKKLEAGFVPGKRVETVNTGPAKSKEQIIADIKARYGY